MTDRTWKKIQFLLLEMAREDPNSLLSKIYSSGIDNEDIEDLHYIIEVARRAPGYDKEADMLLNEGIC